MKIRRARIGGFGNLRGDFDFSVDRCNLVLEPNESGKSTLAAAILAGLYGFPQQRATRLNPIKLKQRFEPWDGGSFALELELDCGDETFIIHRDFAADTVQVREGISGKEITQRFSRGRHRFDVGEELTGLTREDFVKCCLIGQRDLADLEDMSGLTNVLQKMASSQEGDVAAGEAIAVLDRGIDQDYAGLLLKKGKVETEIARLEAEIASTRSALEEISERRCRSEESIRDLEQVQREEDSGEKELRRLEILYLRASERETQEDLERARREAEELARCRSEMEELAPYAEFPSERLPRLLELKGRIEALEENRRGLAVKIDDELTPRMDRLIEESDRHEGIAALTPGQIESAVEQKTILEDLWRQKLETRRQIRTETSRLVQAGVDLAGVSNLRERFSGFDQSDLDFMSRYRQRSVDIERRLLAAQRDLDAATAPLAGAQHLEVIALVLGFLGVVTAIVMWFAMDSRIWLALPAAAVLGGFTWWFWLLERRPVLGAEQFGTRHQQSQTEIWAREKELAELQERLGSLSSRIDQASPAGTLEDFEQLQELEQEISKLSSLQDSLSSITGRYDQVGAELYDTMRQAGYRPAHGAITPRTIRRFKDDLSGYRESKAAMERLGRQIEEQRRDLESADAEAGRRREEMEQILCAGLGEGRWLEDMDASIENFRAGTELRSRLDRLRDEVLPSILGGHPDPPDRRVAKLEPQLASLGRQIADLVAQDPSLEPLEPDEAGSHYARLRREAEAGVRVSRSRRQELLDQVGGTLKQYRSEYPKALARLEELGDALSRAEGFRDAVGIAREVLSGISRRAYTEWALMLNSTTSDILRRLNPGYEDVRFDTDLSFTILDKRGGIRRDQSVVDAQFSSGARDQIYLAVRLALSRHLSSRGSRLPLILDDPFASFDDERFDQAMRFLFQILGEDHQVLLLSCHVRRHRLWQERAGRDIESRVAVLDLPGS